MMSSKTTSSGLRDRDMKKGRRAPDADADMAEAVNYFFPRQNTIGYDEVFKLLLQCCGHASTLPCRCFSIQPTQKNLRECRAKERR
jgi:hypothetical protein